ncbi:hypothetical protein [Geovibrio sp. ADMFC3]
MMEVFEKWLERLAASMTDEEINGAIAAHLTEYDDDGNVAHEPSAEEIEDVRIRHYAALRRGAYGSWQEQLDKQYAGTWESHVAEVKARFGKGSE